MSEKEIREAVRAEWGAAEPSPLVEERMQDAYDMIRRASVRQKGGARFKKKSPAAKWLKLRRAAFGAFGTAAAAFAILIGVGAANPALAAELPIVGGIFAQFSGKTGKEVPPSVNETVIANAAPVERKTQSTLDEDSQVQLEISEASCDGMTLNLAFRLTCKDEELNRMDTLFISSYTAGEEIVLTGNGVGLGNSFSFTPSLRATETPGVYTGVFPVHIPDDLRGAETLDVHCEVPVLRAESYPAGAEEKLPGEAQVTYLKVGWESDFSIAVDSSRIRTYTPDAEFGGVTLEKVVLGDASMEYTVTMPADMDTRAILNPLDDRGEVVSPHIRTNGGLYKDDQIKTMVVFIGAPEASAKSLTFRVAEITAAEDEPVGDLEALDLLGTYTLELE